MLLHDSVTYAVKKVEQETAWEHASSISKNPRFTPEFLEQLTYNRQGMQMKFVTYRSSSHSTIPPESRLLHSKQTGDFPWDFSLGYTLLGMLNVANEYESKDMNIYQSTHIKAEEACTSTTQLPACFWFGFFPTPGQGCFFFPWEVGGPPIP